MPARRSTLLVVVSSLCLGGCKADEPTQIVVAIDTDLTVPDEINLLVVKTDYRDKEKSYNEYDLSAAKGPPVELPATLTLIAGSDPAEPVLITVTGQKGTERIVERRARLPWAPGRILLLRMPLLRSCANLFCEESANETCVDGACTTVDVPEPAKLPDFTEAVALAPLDAGVEDAAVVQDAAPDTGLDSGSADSEEKQPTLLDDFSDGLDAWVLVGSPLPLWLASVKGRAGIFDNNGDPNYDSLGISKALVPCSDGCVIETDVYVDFSDLAGCWADGAVGLSRQAFPDGEGVTELLEWGIELAIEADGDACWGAPADKRRQAWFRGSISTGESTRENIESFTASADAYVNKWTTLRIVVEANREVSFFADGVLIWSATEKLDPEIMAGRNVVLGRRSSGSAGKAYHDRVEVR